MKEKLEPRLKMKTVRLYLLDVCKVLIVLSIFIVGCQDTQFEPIEMNCKTIPFQEDIVAAKEMTKYLVKNIDTGKYFYVDVHNWQEYFFALDPAIDPENKVYIFAYRGIFNTGGYEVKIEKVCADETNIYATIILKDPGVGEKVTDAFTYPMDAISINKEYWSDTKDLIVIFEKK